MNFPSLSQIFGGNSAPAGNAPAPESAQPIQPTPGADAFTKSANPDPVIVPTAPLDTYKDLFTIDTSKQKSDPDAPFITYDDKDLSEKISTMQFMQGQETKDLAQKAVGGDVEALMMLLNKSVQTAYHQGAKLSATVSDRAARAGVDQLRSSMPETMRAHLAKDALEVLNPALNHPSIAPHVNVTRGQFEQKYPNATPSEIARMTNDYFTAIGNATNNKLPVTNQSANAPTGGQDFSGFFGSTQR